MKELAKAIYAVRISDAPSRVLLADAQPDRDGQEPMGVLLIKPSSGHLPLDTIVEILERLVVRHRYAIRSAVWWHGKDIRAHQLMSLHYPGFHRVAHGGWDTLSAAAKAQMDQYYGGDGTGAVFKSVFAVSYERNLARTPYELIGSGLSPEALNRVWERDRDKEPQMKRVQRLDEDAFCLAVDLSGESTPSPVRAPGVVILLNGFFAKLERDFETNGCVAIWIQKRPDSPTSWDALRTEYAGKTNPFQAPPGTIRGDAARGVLPVEIVSILANVIHLSGNEAEGRREVKKVWWAPARLAAMQAGID